MLVGAVTAALINELHGGWVWWVLAGAAALVWAVGSAVLSFRGGDLGRVRVGAGAVYSGGSIRGGVRTRTILSGTDTATSEGGEGIELGPGGVYTGGDIAGPVSTETSLSAGSHGGLAGPQANNARGLPERPPGPTTQ
ncbi:hypothetical protein BKA01_007883 [Pseudonocardia eucalypti]|uniref:hypothetical protein n=1 Tax=Pseudonocardia eucalypti TaxID=648755 RepID=UPI00160D07CF|nr:hypothetical protein [Pseudonocardia eucalypti]